jgi:hypothetical protein
VVATALGVGIPLISAGRAHASGVVLSCAGSSSTTYSPGLTNTAANVTFSASETFGPCVAVGDPTLTGGTNQSNGTFDVSCTTFGLYAAGGAVFYWNNGTSSTVGFTTSVVSYLEDAIQIEQEGTVTSGIGAGETAIERITLATDSLDACSTPQGLTTLGGAITLTFA